MKLVSAHPVQMYRGCTMKSTRISIIMITTILLIHHATSQTTETEEERAFRIKPRPCTDRHGVRGTCMFQWECRQRNGVMLATCLDRFLFGTCCELPDDQDTQHPVSSGLGGGAPLLPDPSTNKVEINVDLHKVNTKGPPSPTPMPFSSQTLSTIANGATTTTTTTTTTPQQPATEDELIDDLPVTFHGPGLLPQPGSPDSAIQLNDSSATTPDVDKLFHQFLGSVLVNYSDSETFNVVTEATTFENVSTSSPAALNTVANDASSLEIIEIGVRPEATPSEVAPSSPDNQLFPLGNVNDETLAVAEITIDELGESPSTTPTTPYASQTPIATIGTVAPPVVSTSAPHVHGEVLQPEVDPTVEYEYYDPDETTLSSTDSSTDVKVTDDMLSLSSAPEVVMPEVVAPEMDGGGIDGPLLEDASEVTYDAELYEDGLNTQTPMVLESATVSATTTVQPETTTTEVATTTTRRTRATTKKPFDYKSDCGVRPLIPNGRIVGGTSSRFGEWPWQVLIKEATWLGLFVKNKCGGVLLNSRYVITAAHCQPSFLASLLVVFGENDLSVSNEDMKPIQRNVRRVVVHRKFNSLTFDNDLALLELERSVEFRPHIVPICLPPDDADYSASVAVVTGWGRLKYGGRLPTDLQQVDVPIIPNSKCQQMFMTAGHIKAIGDKFICAGYQEGAKDSCEGDSGGPLVLEGEDGRWVLIGTVSHGIKCAYPNLPGVYIKISAYKSWIQRIISS